MWGQPGGLFAGGGAGFSDASAPRGGAGGLFGGGGGCGGPNNGTGGRGGVGGVIIEFFRK